MLYRFMGFTFDSDRHELVRPSGEIIPLLGKAEALLQVLLERPGITMSHEELLELVWPDVRTTAASLRRAVYLVRKALELDGDEEDAVLATVRGHGYRLDGPVECVDPAASPGFEAPAAAADATPAGGGPRRRRSSWGMPTAAIAVGGFLLLLFLGRPIPVDAPAPFSEGAPVARPVTSVAVLRFDDMTASGDQGHVAEGMAEGVIHRLAQIPSLHVIARTSSFAMPRGAAISDVGAKLGVGSVLEGSVRSDGERLRVAAQLVRVADETHVFSRVFDLDRSDVFAVEDDIAAEIAATLTAAVEGASSTHIEPRRTPDPRAYDHFLRGATAQSYRDREAATRTVDHFERAVALDPAFAEAWAELARARSRFAFHIRDDPARWHEVLRRADEAAARALALDPTSGLSHAAVAGTLQRRGDVTGAAQELRTAVERAPGYAALVEDYAMTLTRLGRLEQAREQLIRLVELDPLSPLAHRQLGRLSLYLGEPEQAIRSLLRCLELNPIDEDAPRLLADAYTEEGRELEAGEMFIRFYPWPLRGPARAGLRLFGIQAMARISYELLRWRTGSECLDLPYEAAGFLAAAGDGESVFHCLGEAPPSTLTFLGLEPVFAPYREDPRFARLLERSGVATPVGSGEGDATVGSRDQSPLSPALGARRVNGRVDGLQKSGHIL